MRYIIFYFLASILFVSCIEYPFKKAPRKIEIAPKIVGSWNLVSLKGEDSEGRFQYPFDKKVKGFAYFDNENNFSIQYYDATRPKMRFNDPFFCSNAEIRIAFLSGYALFGKYKLFRDTVGIQIYSALNPNLSESYEKRYCKILGDTMLMIAPGKNINGVFLKEHSIWLKYGRQN